MCFLFYSSFVCISAYAYVYFRTSIIKQNKRIILIAGVPSSQALLGFLITAPPSVCVPTALGALAVCSKPTMLMSVVLAKPTNRGKSYTKLACLKPVINVEWVQQLTSSHPSQPSHATPTGHTQAHFMIHGPSLYNNLYKIHPYLNICTERNPMSLTGCQLR